MQDTVIRWAGLWRGDREHFLYENLLPMLFHTRCEAREWIEQKYGYLRTRSDLKAKPFSWKMPIAVKVSVRLTTKSEGR